MDITKMDAGELLAHLRGPDAPAVVPVPVGGRVLGLGRSAAYQAAERGDRPALHLGRRVVVPVPRLLAMLGFDSHSGDRHAAA